LAKRHQQENSAEKVEVFWSCCENEHKDMHTWHSMGSARNKEEGQAKEKVGAYNQAGLQRNACEVLRCHPDDTEQTGVEEVRGGAADAC